MPLQWYADRPSQRTRQGAGDAMVLLCVLLLLRLGKLVYDAVQQLQGAGLLLKRAGGGLAGGLSDSANQVGGAPVVGDRLRGPFEAAAGAARSLASAGAAEQEAAHWLAVVLGLTISLLPITVLVWHWLPRRLEYAREAGAAGQLRGDTELLALRAATSSPLRELARLGPEPVARWRRGEPGAAEALAALELNRLGLSGHGDPSDTPPAGPPPALLNSGPVSG